jgi:hypothetical protein
MSITNLRQLLTAAGVIAFLVGGQPPLASAQSFSSETAAEQPALSDSIRELKSQVSELRQLVMELRAQAIEDRVEASKLRSELEAARARVLAPAGPQSEPQTAQAQPSAAEIQQRVTSIEEDLQLLDGKVNEQAQTKVESASRYRVRLYGIALFNLFGNHGEVDNEDIPSFASMRSPLEPAGSFGGTVRQSTVGLQVFGPQVAGAKTTGDIQMDFGGGFPLVPNGSTMGVARLRTATLAMDWARTSITGGQDVLFFAPLAPTSLASVAIPPLAYAGNLWAWIPQVRIERRMTLSHDSYISFKAGILDSLTGEVPSSQYIREPSAGEASGQPAYAGHISWNGKSFTQNMTIGVGGYYGRQNWGLDRNVDSWAVVSDWNLPLGRLFALSGEFYRGRAIGGLGGASGRSVVSSSIANPVFSLSGLDTLGGWAQLKFMPLPKIEFNAAFGEDNPFSHELSAGTSSYPNPLVKRNRQGFVNVIARPRSDLLLSVEYRHLRTYGVISDPETADHVNVSMGILF